MRKYRERKPQVHVPSAEPLIPPQPLLPVIPAPLGDPTSLVEMALQRDYMSWPRRRMFADKPCPDDYQF